MNSKEEPESTKQVPRCMNTSLGKHVLSIVRGGDYAHPGEEDAIRMVFEDVAPDFSRLILDVGCGLGGTADYLETLGLGRVSGVDIDQAAIDYAKSKYSSEFICCSALEMSKVLSKKFDIISMFNSYYTFPGQFEALKEARAVAHGGTELLIFDYSIKSNNPKSRSFCKNYIGSLFQPVEIDLIREILDQSGWSAKEIKDISPQFELWYGDFLRKAQQRKDLIIRESSDDWYEDLIVKFQKIYSAIKGRVIGGVIIKACAK